MKAEHRPFLLFLGIAVIATLIVAVVLGFKIGTACSPAPVIVPDEVGIDAGPAFAAIDLELDGSIQAAEQRIDELEREHALTIDAFEGEQARKFDEVRRQGPDAMERWFEDFNREILP